MYGPLGEFQSTYPICVGGGVKWEGPICVQKQNQDLEGSKRDIETGLHSTYSLHGYLHDVSLNHTSGSRRDKAVDPLLSVSEFHYKLTRGGSPLMRARQQGAFLCSTTAQECSWAQEWDYADPRIRHIKYTLHVGNHGRDLLPSRVLVKHNGVCTAETVTYSTVVKHHT